MQIKFRGRTYGGKVVFGKGVYSDEFGTHIYFRTHGGIKIASVEPESVAQLIGYDSNGAEVYEGDVLYDDSDKFTVELAIHGRKDNSSVTFETKTNRYRLKEAAT